MAIAAKDMPITREMVYDWCQEADQQDKDREAYMRQQVDKMDLEDRMVDTSQRDDYSADEVDIADLIAHDLPSYG